MYSCFLSEENRLEFALVKATFLDTVAAINPVIIKKKMYLTQFC